MSSIVSLSMYCEDRVMHVTVLKFALLGTCMFSHGRQILSLISEVSNPTEESISKQRETRAVRDTYGSEARQTYNLYLRLDGLGKFLEGSSLKARMGRQITKHWGVLQEKEVCQSRLCVIYQRSSGGIQLQDREKTFSHFRRILFRLYPKHLCL